MSDRPAPRPIPIVTIVGPTAVGKSDLSLDLAERLGGEVVNTDSMQLYRGMDVGTAKLPVAERRGIPHHLLDVLDVTEPATVAEFQSWARAAIADCRSRGVVPILVGGSALYTRAVRGPVRVPGHRPRRCVLGSRRSSPRPGPARLHRRLDEVDPEAAEPDPAEQRTPGGACAGGDRADRQAVQRHPAAPGVRRPGDRAGRCRLPTPGARRADRAAGPADVGRRVWSRRSAGSRRRASREGRTASRALGYQQVLDFLAGECTEQEAFDATVTGTRQVRPQAGRVVPQGPADRLGGLGRRGPGGPGGRAGRARLRPPDAADGGAAASPAR